MTSIVIDRTDGLSSAVAIKGPCRVATTANIVLSGLQTVDGAVLVVGDRVLVKDQTSGSENGIYVVDTGPWRRSKDFNKTRDIVRGTMVFVNNEVPNAGVAYVVTSSPNRVGVDAIEFEIYIDQTLIIANSKYEFETEAALMAANIPSPTQFLDVAGYFAKGDRGGYRAYRISTPSPIEAWHVQTEDGAWWQKTSRDGVIRPEMFGGFPYIVCEAETKAWYDACSTKPTYLHLMHVDRFIRRLKWRGIWSKITCLLALGAAAVSDAGINLKSPGTYNGTINGAGAFTAGVGYTGNNSNAYVPITGWNNLLSQNAAFYTQSFLVNDETDGDSIVSSNTTGSAAGIGLAPRSAGGNFVARLNNTSGTAIARPFRAGNFILSRDNAANYQVYQDGELWQTIAAASIAVTTETATLLKSGGAYGTDTLRLFMCGNAGLSSEQADALDWIIKTFVDGLPGVVGVGPSCASIGFTSSVTDSQRVTRCNAAARFASIFGGDVVLNYGTYLLNGTYEGFVSGVTTRGVSRIGSIIASSAASAETPVVAPPHYNGGERCPELANLTIDGRAMPRALVSSGVQRPGGSGINTAGSIGALIHDVDVIDNALHSIDVCNTGEVLAGQRYYSATSSPTKWDVGVRTRDTKIWNILSENSADDHVTTHYSDGGNGFIRGVACYYASSLHGGGGEECNGVEIDDGSRGFNISDIYVRGVATAIAAKSHVNDPSPIEVNFANIISERNGRGCWFIDLNFSSGEPVAGKHTLTNFVHKRPYRIDGDLECYGIHIRGVRGISIANVVCEANGNEGSATVTMTIASPCVVTWPGHRLLDGDKVTFATTGALPTGVTAGTEYYVVGAASGNFNIATTAGGTAINTSGSQSGTHTATTPYLGSAFYATTGATDVSLRNFVAKNWNHTFNGSTTGAGHVTSSCARFDISNVNISGAGLKGWLDTGSSHSTYENIKVTGTGLATSIGIDLGNGVGTTFDGLKVLDAYSVGVSGFATQISPPTPPTVTIASGVAALSSLSPQYLLIAGEGGVADDLATITGGYAGKVITIRPQSTTVDINVKHGTGNIWLTGLADILLTNRNDAINLICDTDGSWSMIGGGNNQV